VTDTSPEAERTATVLSQSIELALTHQPDAKNKYGSGRIRPERVVFYYLNDRINAHLWGVWVREDGEVTDAPVDQLYRFDDDWPDWLTGLATEHDPREKPAIAWTPDVLEAFWAAAKRANGAPATDPAAPELTADEARDLVDELGTELYRAQDALAFVEECCVIADREGRQPTTADVREWLKGARCGRQLLADAQEEIALRDRIRRVLAQIDGFDFDSLEPHDYQIQAAALAAALPASVDRADVRPTTLNAIANHLETRAVRVFRPDVEVYAEYHAVAAELRRVAAETPNTTEHTYLSTGCLHGEHAYCQSNTGASGAKSPAQCKFCAAPCRCSCHLDAETAPATETEPATREPIQHAPGKVVLCPDCRAKGRTVCVDDRPQAAPPAGGAPQPQTDRDRVVAYRSALPGAMSIYCTRHTDELGDGVTPLTSDGLPDGGVCATCGVDVLIPQPKEG
jgi:hypothetical protein